jgi:methylase of polypeptide subunit release factors
MYTSAPLPFQGQKRRHVKEFSKIISQINPLLVIDLFGGSGLLSHVAKRTCPNARVIYNDYDNYCEQLAHIRQTNKQLRHLRQLLQEYPRSSRITGNHREAVLQYLRQEDKRGYADWTTLSSSLRFTMKYAKNFAEFQTNSLYNNVRRDDYVTDGYLDGLEVVRMDYSDLCEQYRNTPRALFIADPPYLSTDTSTYSSDGYWKLKDYLNVLTALDGLSYVYFTSNKSQIIDLCEWMDVNEGKVRNIFRGASIKTVHLSINYHAKYTDIMMYKLNLKDD